MHGDSSADKAMNSFVEPSQPESLAQANRVLGSVSPRRIRLQTLKANRPERSYNEVRAPNHVCAFLESRAGRAGQMIRMAHEDRALTCAGKRFSGSRKRPDRKRRARSPARLRTIPDTEVKKKAVFALSQMPHEEGVPKLIQVAQNNKNAEVRKQAIFWLGQTNDSARAGIFEKSSRNKISSKKLKLQRFYRMLCVANSSCPLNAHSGGVFAKLVRRKDARLPGDYFRRRLRHHEITRTRVESIRVG